MQLTARPCITAAAALATGSLIAAIPVATPSLPDVQVRDIQLADFFDDLEAQQIASNAATVGSELTNNASLVTGQVDFEEALFGSDSALNGVVNRLYNVNNMFLDYAQNSLNSMLGADWDAGDIHSSLIVGLNPDNVFNSGAIGGLLGVYDQSLIAGADITGVPAIEALEALDQAQQDFNSNLVATELDFNDSLTDGQVAAEMDVFGTDSALNGVVNRLYNMSNMMLDFNQNSLNSMLGADWDAGDIHSSLIVGLNPDIVFNSGEIGGLTGAFDQYLAALADIGGFTQADWNTLFGLDFTDWTTLLNAADVSGFYTDLAGLDWSSLFLNFGDLFPV